MIAIQNARVVLLDEILENGTILIDGENIAEIGRDLTVPEGCEVIDARGKLTGPGFIDIHCHAGGDSWAYDDPVKMARHHLAGGTTSLNCTIYHNIGVQGALDAMKKIRKAIDDHSPGNIMGVHFEGPFLNPKYGCFLDLMRPVAKGEYDQYLREDGDIIKLWTVAPELKDADTFMDAIAEAGIVLAIGHSEAAPDCVFRAVDKGATVCTHIFDATGTAIQPSRWEDTQEVSFDIACMLQDEVFCEVINDSQGAHVRPEMSRFLVKAVGLDRVIAITDACTGTPDSSDLNIVNGELYGSKMMMNQAARNFKNNTRLTDVEVFRVCAWNPARAMHIDDKVGSLAPEKLANIVIVDDSYQISKVLLRGTVAVDNKQQEDIRCI